MVMLDYCMGKLRSIKALKNHADRVFSTFIKSRDNYVCVLCGKTDISNHNGHLFKRGKWSLRFSEINCHCLCPSCNYLDNYEPQHYISWFLNKYGKEKYDELYQISKQLLDKSAGSMRAYLEGIIEKYGK